MGTQTEATTVGSSSTKEGGSANIDEGARKTNGDDQSLNSVALDPSNETEDLNSSPLCDLFDEKDCDTTIFRGRPNHYKTTDELIVRRVYLLSRILSQFFAEHGIPYWASGETALGIERHGGLIPWDDDLDICIPDSHESHLLALTETLRRDHGVEIVESFSGYKVYHLTESAPPQPGSSSRYPFCDIFIMRLREDQYELRNGRSRASWPDEVYMCRDVEPRVARMFGNVPIMCAADQMPYLRRTYGEECMDVGWTHMWSHENGDNLTPQLVCLETVGREPARPFD